MKYFSKITYFLQLSRPALYNRKKLYHLTTFNNNENVTSRKNNDIIKMLFLHTTSNNRLGRKLPSLPQSAITLTTLEKFIFLKIIWREVFYKFQPKLTLPAWLMKVECFHIRERLILPFRKARNQLLLQCLLVVAKVKRFQ